MHEQRALAELLAHWAIRDVGRLSPMPAGTNNAGWCVETSDGPLVLRVYGNAGDARFLRYEHALLRELERRQPSFRVPAPLTTVTGETFVSGSPAPSGGAGDTYLASLHPCLPGCHPARDEPRDALACGLALGELVGALAPLTAAFTPAPWGTYGELDAIHPLVPSAVEIIERLPIDPADRRRFAALVGRVQGEVPELYRTLPTQLVHSDYAASNVLMVEERVAGVLDFEFAAVDLRALDLAIALYQFAFAVSGGQLAVRWDVLEALCAGYAERQRLMAGEIEALPTLLRLRLLASTIHRYGRALRGLADREAVREHALDTLRLDGWLCEHGEELEERIARGLRRSD